MHYLDNKHLISLMHGVTWRLLLHVLSKTFHYNCMRYKWIVTYHRTLRYVKVKEVMSSKLRDICVSEILRRLRWSIKSRKCVGLWYSSNNAKREPNINPLTPNDPYSGRTAPLTSKRCILYIYSTNIGTEYFKRGMYSPFFPLKSAVCLIILTYLVPVLLTFYIQCVLKLKKN